MAKALRGQGWNGPDKHAHDIDLDVPHSMLGWRGVGKKELKAMSDGFCCISSKDLLAIKVSTWSNKGRRRHGLRWTRNDGRSLAMWIQYLCVYSR